MAHHEIITESLANAYWDVPPYSPALTAMVNNTPDSKVALCIESFSLTPVSIIRDAVGLRRRPAESGTESDRSRGRQLDSQLHER